MVDLRRRLIFLPWVFLVWILCKMLNLRLHLIFLSWVFPV